MAQTYITPSRACSSPEPVHTTTQERIETSNNVEDVQGAYIELKDRLVGAIDATRSILTDIKSFNRDSWIVRYPHFNQSPSSTTSTTDDKVKPSRPIRRSLSFADDPSSSRDVLVHPGFHRSMTLADVPEAEETVGSDEPKPETLIPASTDFQVLRLDLKLGHSGASSAASLMTQLEKSSIANLLDDRINASMSHVEKLRTRVEDTSSKVLVTGDLNAGKSTLVNALLRREVLPVDQQPCTAMFCEVHDAADNEGVEEVHLIKEGAAYNIKDESTFTRAKIADLENIVSEAENAQHILKIYVSDARSPTESLLSNGVVDIALIDAPGLNRDSIKTTALFARQEEIDVVVFVVSAENHFTLSAKEFLWNASNEKAYLFIVVNRFDSIKDKARCKRVVLEQIKQLSPRTYEEADDLVHFVDSNSALHANGVDGSFENLESALRSFVLVKRSKSKFAPVTNYLDNLHSDVSLLASSNALLAQSESEQARADLERVKPVLEKMKKNRDGLEDGLETVEERGSSKARRRTQERLNSALENIGKGQLVEGDKSTLPSYPGILGVWEYAKEVRKTLLASLDLSVKLAEDEARAITTEGVNKITDMAETFLPEGVERSRRVFMPQAMFSPRKNKSGGRRYSGAGSIVVAGGVHGLGIGLAQRTDLLEVSFFDIFDAPHHLSVHLNQNGKSSTALTHLGGESGALSVASLGLGALTVAGGKALGARGLIEGVVRIGDLFGNETVRKWAAPVLGAFTIGLTVYLVYELPHNIPRTVGRRIKASLVQHEVEEENEDLKFVNSHCLRVGRETRKVLRLAGWDLKERFRSAMEERSKEVKGKEEMQKRAEKALEFFEGVSERSKTVIESIHA